MSVRSSRAVKLSVAALCSVLLAGCFGGAGSSDSEGSGSSYAGMDPDAGEPKPGGTYITAGPSDASSLDPQTQSSFNTHVAVGAVYSKLMDYKTGPDIEYGATEIEGDLAESAEASPDNMTWTFKLRQGVKFHNKAPVNGREFTSADVKCTLDRIKDVGFQKYLLAPVESYATPDPYTVEFKLKQPVARFDVTMANHYMEILPCEATQGQVDLTNDAIGTGPFVLQSWTRNQERVYVANPDYFIEGKPYLDGYTTIIMPDQQAQIAALRSGKIDYMSSLSTDKRQVENLAKEIDGLTVEQNTGSTPTRVFMNVANAPFDDVNVRKAIAMAIDREGMGGALRAGYTVSGPVTPLLEGALPEDELLEMQPYDPKQAKKLLADAGYPDGFDVTMVLTNGYGDVVVQEAQWIQEDLAKIGVNVTLDVQDYATYFTDTWPKKNYSLGYGLQTPMLSATEFLSAEYLSGGPRNWYNIADSELDTMINELVAISDQAEYEKAAQDTQSYILENVMDPVTLYTYDTQDIYAPYVKDVWAHPAYSRRWLMNMWLDK